MKLAIQGGPGSFNEEAARKYIEENELEPELMYSYTSQRVLEAVTNGSADRGLIAIENAVGGVVFESIHALAEYSCRIVDQLDLLVVHTLLVRSGVKLEDITEIISHPQALKQCQSTLATEFPNIPTRAGEGEAVDQATAAKELAEGGFTPTTAVLAAGICADLYDLDIVARNLQDKEENYTTFLIIEPLASGD